MKGHIVGGDYVNIENQPHAVFIVAFDSLCGGSILNQLIVLTAAHCLQTTMKYDLDTDPISVFAGNNNILKADLRCSKKYATHEGYTEHLPADDIGLVFLETALDMGDHSKRVLISIYFPIEEKEAVVSGWGEVNDKTGEKTVMLKSVKQKIIDVDECATSRYFKAGMMCAGDSLTDRPSRGDSGSGLVTSNHIHIGLVSFRVDSAKHMTFYTNVTYFYSWIENTARDHCELTDTST